MNITRYPTGQCVYLNCQNRRGPNANLRFFMFPKNNLRRRQWIENSGNKELWTYSDERIGRHSLCQVHFSDKFFAFGSHRRLTFNAVPRHYVSGEANDLNTDFVDVKSERGKYAVRIIPGMENTPLSPKPLPVLQPLNTYKCVSVNKKSTNSPRRLILRRRRATIALIVNLIVKRRALVDKLRQKNHFHRQRMKFIHGMLAKLL